MTAIITSLLLLVALPPLRTFTAHVDIENGYVVTAHSRPYMVSVQNRSQHHVCGGFIISERFVLTAAHCRKKKKDLTVVVGAHNLKHMNEGSVRIKVKSYYTEHFKEHPLENDLLLLKLKTKLELNKNVQKISFEKQGNIKSGTLCTVAGWGKKSKSGPISDVLMEAEVKIMDNKKCLDLWTKQSKNILAKFSVSDMMCVSGKGGSCNMDSGGPLVCGGIAVGVMSFGDPDKCNSPSLPNVYTKISAYYEWIKKKIDKKD